jgi:hypothetical protein
MGRGAARGAGSPATARTAWLRGFGLAAATLSATASGAPPPEGHCPSVQAQPASEAAEDAVPRPLREGMLLGYENLLSLRHLVPEEIWAHRHVFFYPGMRMEIGACHRRYATPAFYRDATTRFAKDVELDAQGNLVDYTAGLPFPPETIDPEATDAGLRWAWNLEQRFRGAGPVGHFRLVDMPGRMGSEQTYTGEFFFLQTSARSDLAWRQMRPVDVLTRYSEPDDTFVYVPTMRKSRRAASVWVDGVYMPRYRVSGDSGGGGLPIGGDAYSGPTGAINPTAGESVHVTENLRVGWSALALRPNAYVWRYRGERELLAPLNGAWPGYPIDPDRNFGPHGLSVASDRWDVRWAVLVDGLPRERNGEFDMLTLYLDWQTQQPLYVVTRGRRGVIRELGIPVHRYSEDVLDYPDWPSGERAQVFDPVAEVFFHSTPADPRLRRRFTASDYLARGR